nr:immunoglobulin light chain junction region [Macaca mulatta]
YQQYTNSPFSF